MRLDATSLPDTVHPGVGETLQLQSDQGHQLSARVIGVSPDEITLDANHPLAGHDLSFEIQLLGIGPAATPN